MAHIVEHLSVEELEARYRAAQDATEARHFQAIWLLAEGRTVLEVAEVLAFVPRWVEQLAARYNASGPGALGDRRRRNGRTASLLTPELLAALAERLKRPPDDGGVWSGPEVAAWMARHLGLQKVHPQRGWDALRRLGWSLQSPRPRHPRAATPAQKVALKKLARAVARAKAAHPDRPVALGHHRYAWLHVTAFVQPTSGEAVWYLSTGLSKPLFEALLAAFARQTGAGRRRSIVLVLDNAGWHGPEGLAIPDGISLVFLPPYSPELQPAERLWPLVDEPIVNRHFATLAQLDATVAERCRRLDAATIRPHTDFHWWPRPKKPN